MYRPKAVQIWASHGNPSLRASKEDKQVEGFDISFNLGLPEDRPQTSMVRVPRRAHAGTVEGPCSGHEGTRDDDDDDDDCRSDHGGGDVKRRRKFADYLSHGIRNVDTNGQQPKNHAKLKNKKLSYVLSELDFDRSAFVGTLMNEIENEKINRRSLNAMVKDVDGHPHAALTASTVCQKHIFMFGRCWCDKPLLQWYDQSGRARLTFLEYDATPPPPPL